jgi:hypothetical protein
VGAALVSDRLERLVNTRLRQFVVDRARLAQTVTGVPDDVVVRLTRRFSSDVVVDDRLSPMSTGGHQRKTGDDTGDFVGKNGLVDTVGPTHVPRLAPRWSS